MSGSGGKRMAAGRRREQVKTPFGGWRVHLIGDCDVGHVVPEDDLRMHDLDDACWCRPSVDEHDTRVHNSLDGREMFERGERRVS